VGVGTINGVGFNWTTPIREVWMDRAACVGVDPEIFFPEPSSSPLPAKRVCVACPWGAMTPKGRRKLEKAPRRRHVSAVELTPGHRMAFRAALEIGVALRLPVVHILPKGSFNEWLKSKGKLGGQHKVPRLSNERTILEEILAIRSI